MAKLTQPFTGEVIETLLALESAKYPVFAGSLMRNLTPGVTLQM